ncbi:hypothetical protein [Magnetospirillum fulvum]|uniref:Uncharacterized protein n=1 Tax=Magnetospirillum fulvum TaxID=1082 RepID=A0A1H6JP20_MAGFU|nr:hypothetical protein [Magnetospirillum fulvum]SEH62620.1 hypothetical protein SAMN04244559_03217 [Magnetospirillum fulvum]
MAEYGHDFFGDVQSIDFFINLAKEDILDIDKKIKEIDFDLYKRTPEYALEQKKINEIKKSENDNIINSEKLEFSKKISDINHSYESLYTSISDAIKDDSKTWVFNKYKINSLSSPIDLSVSKFGGENFHFIKAYYTYNGNLTGYARFAFRIKSRFSPSNQAAGPACIIYHDAEDNCRSPGSPDIVATERRYIKEYPKSAKEAEKEIKKRSAVECRVIQGENLFEAESPFRRPFKNALCGE